MQTVRTAQDTAKRREAILARFKKLTEEDVRQTGHDFARLARRLAERYGISLTQAKSHLAQLQA